MDILWCLICIELLKEKWYIDCKATKYNIEIAFASTHMSICTTEPSLLSIENKRIMNVCRASHLFKAKNQTIRFFFCESVLLSTYLLQCFNVCFAYEISVVSSIYTTCMTNATALCNLLNCVGGWLSFGIMMI